MPLLFTPCFNLMIESYLLSGIAFLGFLVIHAVVFYGKRPQEPWRMVSRLAKLFFLVYTSLFFLIPFPNWFMLMADSTKGIMAAYVNGAVLYLFLFLSYAQFYFLIDRGISARILVELLDAGGSLRLEELRKRYDPRVLQDRRLTDMMYGGHIREQNGIYTLSKKGRLLANVFRCGKKIFHFYPGG